MIETKKEIDRKLVPVLREGVEVVKMILFMKLKGHIREKNPAWPPEFQIKIVGAVINDLFGTINPDRKIQEFAQENRKSIEEIINEIPTVLRELQIPLTDALRTAVLCDYQEGMESSAVLAKAQKSGVLLVDRDLPMPNRFIELVRRLGESFGLVVPPGAL